MKFVGGKMHGQEVADGLTCHIINDHIAIPFVDETYMRSYYWPGMVPMFVLIGMPVEELIVLAREVHTP